MNKMTKKIKINIIGAHVPNETIELSEKLAKEAVDNGNAVYIDESNKPKKESKINTDLNNDSVVDKKDTDITAKVVSHTRHKK